MDIIDLMPKDFAVEPYCAIRSLINTKINSHPDSWTQFAGSWNAVAIRFLSCVEHDVKFTESIKKAGNSPPHPERYFQERELFGFFVTGLSTIESFCYGLYAIGSILKPLDFPFQKPKDMKNVTPEDTFERFKNKYKGEKITLALNQLIDSSEYKEWKEIRNILAHRIAPGRSFHHGGSHHGETLWIKGIQIDNNTTVSRRKWLAKTFSNILQEAKDFTDSQIVV